MIPGFQNRLARKKKRKRKEKKEKEKERREKHLAYPESTPRTRLRTKKDPMMIRGMKYSQFQVAPKASLV